MALEIERKFVVDLSKISLHGLSHKHMRQGYIVNKSKKTVRVRIVDNEEAILCIKLRVNDLTSEEYEYEISIHEAEKLLKDLPCVEKNRYEVNYLGKKWEVDIFCGHLNGLVLAECECESEDEALNIDVPDWCVKDVTNDKTYKNANLVNAILIN